MSVPRDVCHLTPDGDWVPGPPPLPAPVVWPYTQHRRLAWRTRDERRADPVNLFVIGRDPAAVAADLAAAGWGRPGDGAVHRTWIDGRFARMATHTALGTRARRVHVRLWAVGGGTLAAAHDEEADRGGRHIVVSWDAARDRVREALLGAGYAALAPSAVVAAAGLRGVPGDGRIWRLAAP
ncbi:MAG: hypothetical protein AB1416_05470 [Actinomycetota bacterium]